MPQPYRPLVSQADGHSTAPPIIECHSFASPPRRQWTGWQARYICKRANSANRTKCHVIRRVGIDVENGSSVRCRSSIDSFLDALPLIPQIRSCRQACHKRIPTMRSPISLASSCSPSASSSRGSSPYLRHSVGLLQPYLESVLVYPRAISQHHVFVS